MIDEAPSFVSGFIVYDGVGTILRWGAVMSDMVAAQSGEGEMVIAVSPDDLDGINDTTHRVAAGGEIIAILGGADG